MADPRPPARTGLWPKLKALWTKTDPAAPDLEDQSDPAPPEQRAMPEELAEQVRLAQEWAATLLHDLQETGTIDPPLTGEAQGVLLTLQNTTAHVEHLWDRYGGPEQTDLAEQLTDRLTSPIQRTSSLSVQLRAAEALALIDEITASIHDTLGGPDGAVTLGTAARPEQTGPSTTHD